MQQDNGIVPWKVMFSWLNKNKIIILFGSLAGLGMLLAITTISVWVFNMIVQPFTIGIFMTLYYAILSAFAGDRRELFIKEAWCYHIATVVIFALGIEFSLPSG